MCIEHLEPRRLFAVSASSRGDTKLFHETVGTAYELKLGSAVLVTANAIKLGADSTGSVLAIHADIHWGDGKTSAGKIVKNSDGTYHIDGTHAYASTGKYHVVAFVSAFYTGSGPHPQFIIPYETLHDAVEVSAAANGA